MRNRDQTRISGWGRIHSHRQKVRIQFRGYVISVCIYTVHGILVNNEDFYDGFPLSATMTIKICSNYPLWKTLLSEIKIIFRTSSFMCQSHISTKAPFFATFIFSKLWNGQHYDWHFGIESDFAQVWMDLRTSFLCISSWVVTVVISLIQICNFRNHDLVL